MDIPHYLLFQEYLEQDAKQMKAKMDTENKGMDILFQKIKLY